jgi:hypothetical protein
VPDRKISTSGLLAVASRGDSLSWHFEIRKQGIQHISVQSPIAWLVRNTLQYIEWYSSSGIMRGLQALIIVAGLLATCTQGLTLKRRTDGRAKVVGLPVQRRELSDPIARDRLRRRTGTVSENLDNEVYIMTFWVCDDYSNNSVGNSIFCKHYNGNASTAVEITY